jgi:hypothetical protein
MKQKYGITISKEIYRIFNQSKQLKKTELSIDFITKCQANSIDPDFTDFKCSLDETFKSNIRSQISDQHLKLNFHKCRKLKKSIKRCVKSLMNLDS